MMTDVRYDVSPTLFPISAEAIINDPKITRITAAMVMRLSVRAKICLFFI